MCPGDETVGAYVAGQLADSPRTDFERHLDGCSTCQQLVASLAKAAPAPTPGPTIDHGLAPTVDGFAGDTPDRHAGSELGRYVLLARLGAGGMGVVYSAYDPELDRRVALKVLRHAHAGQLLREEARAIARLAHPNVVAVHDVGRAGDEVFVAMEHVEGVTVREWLAKPHMTSEIVDVFLQAGRGLAAAHRVGLVHRDIKPSNIMVGADGRARVLDFGLARVEAETDGFAGTPAYMAPEQKRGERLDARADQYSFCVSLEESLAGKSDVPERITRALKRGLAESPAERFSSMDELLRELAPPPRRATYWIVATTTAVLALGVVLVYAVTREQPVSSCSRAGAPIAQIWGDPQRVVVRTAFAATNLPFAASAADTTISNLDRWTQRWARSAEASCRATVVERAQPAEVHLLRQACLDELAERLRPLVEQATRADAATVNKADVITARLTSPERCDDVKQLMPLPTEGTRTEVAELRTKIAELESAIMFGHAREVEAEASALVRRADAIDYLPLRARSHHMLARLYGFIDRQDRHVAELHAAAQWAAASRDLTQLAQIWLELSRTLGNDLRTPGLADVFESYAAALIPQLPDRAAFEFDLAFARCQRNGRKEVALALAEHCTRAIDLAEKMSPPNMRLANAARTRLGHFQRVAGKVDEAIATLKQAVVEVDKLVGRNHPESATARYALGVVELAQKQADAGLAHMKEALAIREAVFPDGSPVIAEALQGIGDNLSTTGRDAEAVPYFERALVELDRVKEGESMYAANVHLLLGISLETIKRPDDAILHYVRSADIADRSLAHEESYAATALHLAANVEATRDHIASGVMYLERAVGLHERGKSPPHELGHAQLNLAEMLARIDRKRARVVANAARTSYLAAGPAHAKGVQIVDALLAKLR